MSLEGGFDELEEFFFSRATSASSSAIRAFNGATTSATALSIIACTCFGVKHDLMPLWITHRTKSRNTTTAGFGVNGYLTREDILNYALALPPGDRELVAVALQDSLEAERNPAESLAGNEFYEELRRRSAAYRAGPDTGQGRRRKSWPSCSKGKRMRHPRESPRPLQTLLFLSLKPLDAWVVRQQFHLMDGDLIQLAKAFRLRHVLPDEQGVQVLQVGKANELRHVRIVPDIAFPARILVAPVLRRHAEERHVQHVRLRGINQVGLARAQFRRHKVLLDRIGVDAVIDLGQIAPDVPAKLLEFLVLEPLKFLDEIEFEFGRKSRTRTRRRCLCGRMCRRIGPAWR